MVPPGVPNHGFVPRHDTYATSGLPRRRRLLTAGRSGRCRCRGHAVTTALPGRGNVLLLLYPRRSVHRVHRVVRRLVHPEGRMVRARLTAVRTRWSVRSRCAQPQALVQHHVLLVQRIELVHKLVRGRAGRRMGQKLVIGRGGNGDGRGRRSCRVDGFVRPVCGGGSARSDCPTGSG